MEIKKQNLDGICGLKKRTFLNYPVVKKQPLKIVAMDGIRLAKKPTPKPIIIPTVRLQHQAKAKISAQSHIKFDFKKFFTTNARVLVTACVVLIAFGFGIWFEARTPKSSAETIFTPEVSAVTSKPIFLAEAPPGVTAPSNTSNEALFNTPIELLKDYLAAAAAPDQMEVRKAKLKQFLKDWDSPLVEQTDIIAEQDHWKLILSIAFAESTLGKHCYKNNCSGIGGSNIREYKSLDNWILDFNRLLERRYKGDTLEQMCGVYVQPCNPNWLVANKQILTALDEAGIE